MKIMLRAVALCCTVLLAGCFPPVTTHPVGRPTSDSLLMGRWIATMDEADKDDDKASFRFERQPGGLLRVRIESLNPKKADEDRLIAMVSTTRAGDQHVLNARLIDMGKKDDAGDPSGDEQPDGTIPVLYRQEGDAVVLYLLNEDKTKAAIAAKKIDGKVEPGTFGDATITASSSAMTAFFATPEGAALFSEKFATLRRH